MFLTVLLRHYISHINFTKLNCIIQSFLVYIYRERELSNHHQKLILELFISQKETLHVYKCKVTPLFQSMHCKMFYIFVCSLSKA